MTSDDVDKLCEALKQNAAVISAALGGVEQAIRDTGGRPPASKPPSSKRGRS